MLVCVQCGHDMDQHVLMEDRYRCSFCECEWAEPKYVRIKPKPPYDWAQEKEE